MSKKDNQFFFAQKYNIPRFSLSFTKYFIHSIFFQKYFFIQNKIGETF